MSLVGVSDCNGCEFERRVVEARPTLLLLRTPDDGQSFPDAFTLYARDEDPLPGQGEPVERLGQPIRFLCWLASPKHADDCGSKVSDEGMVKFARMVEVRSLLQDAWLRSWLRSRPLHEEIAALQAELGQSACQGEGGHLLKKGTHGSAGCVRCGDWWPINPEALRRGP